MDGKGQAVEKSFHRHPAGALVGGEFVFTPLGIIEFPGAGVDHYIGKGALPVIDLRTVNLQARYGYRRDIFHHKGRQPLRAHLIHRTERHAVAVGVLQSLVDPVARLGWQPVGVHLARREHHLSVYPVYGIAVHIHIGENVIGPNLLDLLVRLDHWALVPYPDIADGQWIGLNIRPGEIFRSLKRLFLDPV